MSNVNNQFKELVNEAIHNHFHDKTETEMILKDWLYGICEQLDEYEQHKVATSILVNTLKSKADEYEAKAKAFDETIEILKELRDFSKKTEPHSQRMKEKRRNYVQFCDEVLREIKLSHEEIIDEYESGESDE